MAEKRILIAEDDRATRESWSELLGSWGYRVEMTENGPAGARSGVEA